MSWIPQLVKIINNYTEVNIKLQFVYNTGIF